MTVVLSLAGLVTTAWFDPSSLDNLHWVRLAALAKVVALPLAAGLLARRLAPAGPGSWLKYIPSACIIAMVWMSVSKHAPAFAGLRPELALDAAAISLALHFCLYALAAATGRLLELPRADKISLNFVASQKTLPLALLLLMAYGPAPLAQNPGPAGLAVVFCLVFHFTQITADSLLASRLAAQARPNQVQ
jgi:predicted Na+-dependent transporter